MFGLESLAPEFRPSEAEFSAILRVNDFVAVRSAAQHRRGSIGISTDCATQLRW
jgi:hypothetical protein